ncbi:hypothetical protein CISG_07445 [Coccidioides immitis RMSCC 3703]|uniref:Uncharacterized protein n=1 Tax=Coccidioides immitis RMSCC 3703 TaxID=454286 RepID=A0A0J8R124_COCIT|nr:hypothetical protein CISG_07445 [Coccidioides immitis RMSCC 3703]
MAMTHYKCVTVNTSNMKLVLGINAKIRSNYFSLIDASDHSAPAVIICCLHAVSALPTTTATTPSPPSPLTTASLPPPGTIRVFTHQMAGIRVSVWFTKPVLEKQEEKKKKKKKKKWEKKKKREEKDNNNDEDDNDND